jgi:DNA-binding protein HU-beta
MNKSELIDSIAKEADINKTDAEKILNAITGVITKNLKKAGKIQIIGFGSFEMRQRAARNGRNPKTGATIKIKASKSAAFVAGKGLKDAVK